MPRNMKGARKREAKAGEMTKWVKSLCREPHMDVRWTHNWRRYLKHALSRARRAVDRQEEQTPNAPT